MDVERGGGCRREVRVLLTAAEGETVMGQVMAAGSAMDAKLEAPVLVPPSPVARESAHTGEPCYNTGKIAFTTCMHHVLWTAAGTESHTHSPHTHSSCKTQRRRHRIDAALGTVSADTDAALGTVSADTHAALGTTSADTDAAIGTVSAGTDAALGTVSADTDATLGTVSAGTDAGLRTLSADRYHLFLRFFRTQLLFLRSFVKSLGLFRVYVVFNSTRKQGLVWLHWFARGNSFTCQDSGRWSRKRRWEGEGLVPSSNGDALLLFHLALEILCRLWTKSNSKSKCHHRRHATQKSNASSKFSIKCACMCTQTHRHTNTQTHKHTNTHTHTHKYTHTHTQIHTHKYTHTHTHTHTHTNTHTHKHTNTPHNYVFMTF